MEPITLVDAGTGSTARIAAHLGFNCYEFEARFDDLTVDVLDSDEQFIHGAGRPSGNGIPLLFPFPNRIRAGRYSWAGREYTLPETAAPYDGAGNAIHGFALDRAWRVVEQQPDSVTGQFQLSLDAPHRRELWPADCVIDVKYALHGTTLRMDVRIANPDDVPLPWGFGTHPYFRLPLSNAGDPAACRVYAPAGGEWELEDCLPTGTRRPVAESRDLRNGACWGDLALDDVYTGLEADDGRIECRIVDEASGLEIAQTSDALFRELVAYTPPDRNSVCLEPYTCVTDAINLSASDVDAGLQVLEPGDEIRTWIEIEVRDRGLDRRAVLPYESQ